MDTVLTYQDPAAALVLQELRAYLAQQPAAPLLCTAAQPVPGFPVISDRAEHVYRNYRHYVHTPWGLATYAEVRYAAFPNLSYLGLHTLTEPLPDAPLPSPTLPTLAAAVVNPLTGLVAVYTTTDTAGDFTDAQPLWEGKITLPERWRDLDILRDIRLALAQAGVPLYPGTLYAERVAYPWLTAEGLPASAAFIANGEVRLPVIGYAVDPESDALVYLNLVGHKTAARSIWGSLSTMHQRKLTLESPAHRALTVQSAHHYATYTTCLDADIGLWRMQLVDRRALLPDVTDRAYLVAPAGLDAAAVDTAFAARLTAVLPVGIPAQWGAALRQAGDDLGLVRACLSGGDVGLACALTAEAQWLDLLAELLHSDPTFVLPETLT